MSIIRKVKFTIGIIRVVSKTFRYIRFVTFGITRPKEDERRPPHEHFDHMRPNSGFLGKLIQMLLFLMVFLWILRIQSYVVPSQTGTLQSWALDHLSLNDPWWATILTFPIAALSRLTSPLSLIPWAVNILVLVATVIFYHRGVFRALLIFANEPYTDNRKFYFAQLRNGLKHRKAERVLFGSLALTVILDLLQQVGDPRNHSILNTVAFVSLCIAVFSALVAGVNLGRWYKKDVVIRYELLKEFQVAALCELPDDVHGLPKLEAKLASVFEARNLPALQRYAESIGYTVTGYDLTLLSRHAVLTPTIVAEQEVYETAARNLSKPVYEFDIAFGWVDNDRDDRALYPERLDTVTLNRAPVGGLDPDKRAAAWAAIILGIQGWGNGCLAIDTNDNPIKTLQYGKERSLPTKFLTGETLPEAYSPDLWWDIPDGISSSGVTMSRDLSKFPHGLTAGQTNSGKSTQIRQSIISRIVRGHRVCLFDAAKDFDDARPLKPWTLMWGTTLTEIANGLAMLYEENKRRRKIFKIFKVANWYDLPHGAAEEHGIFPISIFFDEYEGAVDIDKPDPNLPKGSAFALSQQADWIAVSFIRAYMRKLATQARATGIFIELATQTPLASALGSNLRNNLTGATQLYDPTLTSGTAGLALGGMNGPLAMDLFRMFSEFGSIGLGVRVTEGGAPEAFRVAYSGQHEGAEIFAGFGIEIVEPWLIRDVLELGIVREEDDDEHRKYSLPRFTSMTHMDGGDLDALDDADPSSSTQLESVAPPAVATDQERPMKLRDMFPRNA